MDNEKTGFLRFLIILFTAGVLIAVIILLSTERTRTTDASQESPQTILKADTNIDSTDSSYIVSEIAITPGQSETSESDLYDSEYESGVFVDEDVASEGGYEITSPSIDELKKSWVNGDGPKEGLYRNSDGVWYITEKYLNPTDLTNAFLAYIYEHKQVVPIKAYLYCFDKNLKQVTASYDAYYSNGLKDGYILYKPTDFIKGDWYMTLAFDTDACLLGNSETKVFQTEDELNEWAYAYMAQGAEENALIEEHTKEIEDEIASDIASGITTTYDKNVEGADVEAEDTYLIKKQQLMSKTMPSSWHVYQGPVQEPDEFIKMVAKYAQNEYRNRSRWILPSVCIAQACLETGFGHSKRMMDSHALFGIKAGSSWVERATYGGLVYSTKTREVYNGQSVVITGTFRAYNSYSDSVSDYYDLLTNSDRYTGAVNVSEPSQAIEAIKRGGYATAPTYVDSIMTLIQKYNLTQYDY